jgi:DNA ligase (NAD+)
MPKATCLLLARQLALTAGLLLALLLALPSSRCLADNCPELPLVDAQKQVTHLRGTIRYHNDLYYQKQQPEISDAEYDRLFAELALLESCFPALGTAGSPTTAVGSDAQTGASLLRHERPMLSLSSATGPEAVAALLHRAEAFGPLAGVEAGAAAKGSSPGLLVQPKVDGLPVELMYQSGRLMTAATRGDGRHGEDVTSRARRITGIPQVLSGSYPARVVVRGEIYADLGLMAAAIRAGAEPYATPRHFAAGTLRSQAPAPQALRALRLFPFELVYADNGTGQPSGLPSGLTSDLAALALLAGWGFPAHPDLVWQAETLEQVRSLYAKVLASRQQLPFAADGIVVKFNDLALRRRLGEGARAPFWAAAWKFPPATASTLVRAIRWQTGRTGRRTPIAELEPITLGGVRVAHVSLQNSATLARLGLAAGDRVTIALVADVIPQVQAVIKGGIPPERSGRWGAAAGEPALDACLSDTPQCRAQFLARATHFVSKSGLNIAGLGRGRLQKLIEAGLVTDLPALFRLTPQEIAAVPGFSATSARRLTEALRHAGRGDPFRVLVALGIPGVGPAAAQRLARQYGTLGALLAAKDEAGGGGAAAGIRRFFATGEGTKLLAGFRDLGLL